MAKSGLRLQALMLLASIASLVANDVCLETTCGEQAAACSSAPCASAKDKFISLTQGSPLCDQACFDASVPPATQFADRLKLNQFTSCYTTCYGLLDIPDTTTPAVTTTTVPSPCAALAPNPCVAQEARCFGDCADVRTCLYSCSEGDSACQSACATVAGTPAIDVLQASGTLACVTRRCSSGSSRAVSISSSRANSWLYLEAHPYASQGNPALLTAALGQPATVEVVKLWVQLHNGLMRYQADNGMTLLPFDLTALTIHQVYFNAGATPPETFPLTPQFAIAATYDAVNRQLHVQSSTDELVLSQLLVALAPAPSTTPLAVTHSSAARESSQPTTSEAKPTPVTGLAIGSNDDSGLTSTTVIIIAVGSVAVAGLLIVIVARLRKMRVASYDLALPEYRQRTSSKKRGHSIHLERVESSHA